MKHKRTTLLWVFRISLITPLTTGLAASAANKPDPRHGAKVFQEASCAVCHPGGGNTTNPKKPIKGDKFVNEYKDDSKIEKVVRHGLGSMPAFNPKMISDSDLKDLIAYIRSLTPKKGK